MPSLFWTGRLSPAVKFMVNANSLFAWLSGRGRDSRAMKQRIRQGYEAATTDHVTRYDELGSEHYRTIAEALLEGIPIENTTALDTGCGTGIAAFLLMEKSAHKVVCADISDYMLSQCRAKAALLGYGADQMAFRRLDTEHLPFDSGSFDNVVSNMVLGMVPNQHDAVKEMARVLKPSGMLCLATHGPEHYYEASDLTFRSVPKLPSFGYRVEFWPRHEKEVVRMFSGSGLTDCTTRRLRWKQRFADPAAACDFVAATSSMWWYSRFPTENIPAISAKIKKAFIQKPLAEITMDVILAHGRKP